MEKPVKTNAEKFKEVFRTDVNPECCGIFRCDKKCSECEYSHFWEHEYHEPKE